MPRAKPAARIYVLAGTNGAGKSSIAGFMFLARGVPCFNPDVAAQRILSANPHLPNVEANSIAWNAGKRLLQRAIAEKLDFAFETTLGGYSITTLLDKALTEGMEVRIWYVGLSTVELHLARVQARVARGGHDIPEERIRERFVHSRLNLIRLLPKLTELLLYDNSEEADLAAGKTPKPVLLLHFVHGKVMHSCDLRAVPEWAKPIFAKAMSEAK